MKDVKDRYKNEWLSARNDLCEDMGIMKSIANITATIWLILRLSGDIILYVMVMVAWLLSTLVGYIFPKRTVD